MLLSKSEPFGLRLRALSTMSTASSRRCATCSCSTTRLRPSGGKNKKHVDQLEQFATGAQASILKTQEEVNRTQQAIQSLIDSTKADGSSSVSRSGSGDERDRQVFDPRDYKIDVLPSQFALGVWKKWVRGGYLHRHHRPGLAWS